MFDKKSINLMQGLPENFRLFLYYMSSQKSAKLILEKYVSHPRSQDLYCARTFLLDL
jgi:hypothetical protein